MIIVLPIGGGVDFIQLKSRTQQWVGGGIRVADHIGVGALWGQLICVVRS
jgi:hypothetical protein